MSVSIKKMTLQQERAAYKRAVQKSLVAFFDQTAVQADFIVNSWWDRMEGSVPYTTGIFMHDEPINTAAELAGIKRAPSIREVGARYSKIIQEAMPKSRMKLEKHSRKHSEPPKQDARAA